MSDSKFCKPEIIVLEITNRCNNSCLHCYNYWRGNGNLKTKELSRFEIRDIIRKLENEIPLKQVTISGGEPFLRKDLPGIVVDIRLENLNTVIITNGSLITNSILGNLPTGTTFEITLFSYNKNLHNKLAGRDVFEKILKNLLLLEKHNCIFVLSLVITKLNAPDTLKTIELGIALGAKAVILNRINLSHYTYRYAETLVPSLKQLKQSLADAEKAAREYKIGTAITVPIPACLVNPDDYPHLRFGWCPRGGENSYYTISSTGDIRPCNHSSLILGNIKKEKFSGIISGQTSKNYWNHFPYECKDCNNKYKSSCLGGCPAASAECLGSMKLLDPFIEYSLKN
jgi:radical SAM protein with 4Fe4S-binding SPASM domain